MLLILIQPIVITNCDSIEDWLDGYTYRQKHTITGSLGAGTDYIMRFYVLKGSGTSSGDFVYLNNKCKDDFTDVRFTTIDGKIIFPLWKEFYTSVVGVFWVSFASESLDEDLDIYIYYGNPDATDVSQTDFFLLFDHFESWDTSKWKDKYSETGTRTVEDSRLKLYIDSGTNKYRCVQSQDSFGLNTCVRFCMKYYLWRTDRQFELGFLDDPKTDADKSGAIYDSRNAYRRWYNWDNGEYQLHSYMENDVPVSGDDLDIRRFSTRNEYWTHSYWLSYPAWNDDIHDATITIDVSDAEVPITFSLKAITGSLNSELHIDWVFVRKYIRPEPSYGTYGSQEKFYYVHPHTWTFADILRMLFIVFILFMLVHMADRLERSSSDI